MKFIAVILIITIITTFFSCSNPTEKTANDCSKTGTWIVLSNSYQTFSNSNLEFSQTDYEQELFIFDDEGGYMVTDPKNEQKIHYTGSYSGQPFLNVQLDGEFVKFEITECSDSTIQLVHNHDKTTANIHYSDKHRMTLRRLR